MTHALNRMKPIAWTRRQAHRRAFRAANPMVVRHRRGMGWLEVGRHVELFSK